MTFFSFLLARKNKTKRECIPTPKPIMNGSIRSVEQITKPEIQQILSPPIVRIENNRSIFTKESSTETDDEHLNNIYQSNEHFNLETKSNHLILSEGYLEFYQPDAESGLIRPLTKRADAPKRYTKYISSNN
jgi:hypothetical protein